LGDSYAERPRGSAVDDSASIQQQIDAVFIPRDAMPSTGVRLSVSPSYTCSVSMQTAKDIIKHFIVHLAPSF